MFGKYKISDLYLAIIKISQPDAGYDPETGLLRSSIARYKYFTIFYKRGNNYIDLKNNKILSNDMASYEMDFFEPLSNYYTLEGKGKNNLNKKEAIEESKKYFKTIYKKKINI